MDILKENIRKADEEIAELDKLIDIVREVSTYIVSFSQCVLSLLTSPSQCWGWSNKSHYY